MKIMRFWGGAVLFTAAVCATFIVAKQVSAACPHNACFISHCHKVDDSTFRWFAAFAGNEKLLHAGQGDTDAVTPGVATQTTAQIGWYEVSVGTPLCTPGMTPHFPINSSCTKAGAEQAKVIYAKCEGS